MTQEIETPRRIPRWLRITLFASLACNLIIVGLVVGIAVRGGPPEGAMRAGVAHVMPFTRALERDDRRILGRQIRERLRAERSRSETRTARAALHAQALILLRAQSFDGPAFDEIMAQLSDQARFVAQAGRVALVGHLEKMSQADRHAYADRVEDAIKSRRSRSHDH